MKNLTREKRSLKKILNDQTGAIGYVLAWLMGVPASVLLVIWTIRGFH